MRKREQVDESWPDWFNGKKIDEVQFCAAFLEEHPMICVSGDFFSLDGRIADETTVAKLIYNMIKPVWTSGLAKKARNLMETLKIECYSNPLEDKQDRIHFANSTLFLDGRFTTGKNYCINRLPVRYNLTAPDGFYRRHLILTAKDKSKGRADDPFIAEKMCAEAESIVLWAIQGLKRLIANNYVFTESERVRGFWGVEALVTPEKN